MSNPLRWFRKYEKIMLGVFGVALMVAFTFSLGVSGVDMLGDLARGNTGGGGGGGDVDSVNPVVATWKEGDLREKDFEDLRVGRNLLLQFSQIALNQAQARGGQPRTNTIPPQNSDGSLLELAVLSRKAADMGIQIPDEGILDYLVQLTDNRLKRAEFSNIWQSMTRGQMTDNQLLALMRRELLAMRMRSMMQSGNFPVSPLRQWDFYNRLERSVKAEVMALPVDEYLAQVADPDPAELKTFFEKYKHQYAYPDAAEPGFKQREQAAFEYIKVDFDDFFQAELALVSDEEMEEYYQANMDAFREQSFLEDDLDPEVPAMPDATADLEDADAADADTSDKDAVESDTNETETPKSDPAEPTDDVAPAAESATDEIEIREPDPAEPSNDEAPAVESATDETETREPDPAEPSNDETADAEPDPAPSPAPQAESDAAPTESEEQPAPEDDSAPDTPAGSGTEAAEDSNTDSDVKTETETDEEKPAKYKPLEKVADEIKRSLARPRAQKKMDDTIAIVRRKADLYYRRHVKRSIQKDDSAAPPAKPDLADIDSPKPLKIETLPLLDVVELANMELGAAYDIQFTQSGLRQIMFGDVAFGEKNVPLYQANLFPNSEAAPIKYLYWTTEEREAYEPKLEDVREQAIAAWKKNKATELALQAAEDAAAKARESQQPLAVTCAAPGRTFFDTNEITWLTGGNVPMDTSTVPQPTAITGVDAGDDFYRTLFSLSKDEIGVSLDRGKNNAYVLRVTDQSPDLDVRQAGFFENAAMMPGMYYVAQAENRRDLGSVYRAMLEDDGVEWKREPRASGQ